MAKWPSYTATRFPLLGVAQVEKAWRFVCLDFEGGGTTPTEPACIGPQYRSKAELMADLERFGTVNGYAPDPKDEAISHLRAALKPFAVAFLNCRGHAGPVPKMDYADIRAAYVAYRETEPKGDAT